MAIRITKCPFCSAYCVEGHDDDGQIYCACCRKSFTPDNLTKMTAHELKEKMKNAVRYEAMGWQAFKPKP